MATTCNNCCSEIYSSSSLKNSCREPITSSSGHCSPEVSCEEAPCSPSSSLHSSIPGDHLHEPCSEHMSCQSTSCDRGAGSPSGCSPVVSGMSESYQGTGYLPNTSHGSSFCGPAFRKHPVSCHFPTYQSYGYQPLRYLTYGFQPLRCLSYDHQPLRNLSYQCQPVSCMSDYHRLTNYTYSIFNPYSSSLGGWQYH